MRRTHRRRCARAGGPPQVTADLQDLRWLRLDLEPWRDPQAVRELDEQLAAVGGA
jgi:hypothetical protein